MPKTNPLINDIHAIYARQAIHVMVFAFVRGAQRMAPSISKKEAAEAFLVEFTNEAQDYDVKEVINIFDSINRDILNKRYVKAKKTQSDPEGNTR